MFNIKVTGCQWKMLPRSLGAPSTVHDRFQEWREAGLFEAMWKAGLMEYDMKKGIEGTGANPTDRGKKIRKGAC